MSKPHLDYLNKIHSAIYKHIDQIIKLQETANGELPSKEAYVLIEYSKLFRTDKSIEDDIDYSKLSEKELNDMIQEELKKVKK